MSVDYIPLDAPTQTPYNPEMELKTFAETLLLGTALGDKLLQVNEPLDFTDQTPGESIHTPKFPGRPECLARREKAQFPSLDTLHSPTTRGEILHFFANHELLALELMALLLLKFPEAPTSFRLGIARTIREEQNHLFLYITRMKELGVELGQIPVNDYFWNALSPMRTPMDFVVQMSLTFEQANLDFSLFFRNEIEKTGDEKTTEILDRVFQEEIGHVKHGVTWFNRWRESGDESDWDAYRRLLPAPMTARRAKGPIFCEDARRKAGFSELFIQELELYTGAKGRPPVLWIYNPFCDAENARGKPGHTPAESARRLSADLEHLPMFLASEQDLVATSRRPSLSWLRQMRDLGFSAPEWTGPEIHKIREPKFGGLQPWGWSPDVFENFRPLRGRLARTPGGNARWCETLLEDSVFSETGLTEIFSKSWSVNFLKGWLESHPLEANVLGCAPIVGKNLSDPRELKNLPFPLILKAPFSTSGNGCRRVFSEKDLDPSLLGWATNTIASQGSIVVEPWLDKVYDFSMQMEIQENKTRLFDARRFLVGERLEYRGTLLGPLRQQFDAPPLQLLYRQLDIWKMLTHSLASELRRRGYEGPAGIDAMIYRDSQTRALRLKPLVELNPRWTMGRVALALEDHLAPGIPGAWIFLRLRDLHAKGFANALDFSDFLAREMPTKGERIADGAVCTTDPSQAQDVLSVLVAGSAIPRFRELGLI